MQQRSKNAFTMVEIVFVIVILGILAAIAVPRFAATRDDADITKGRADIAAIRSAIITERQARLITGDSSYISASDLDNGGLFGGVLMYPITSGSGNGHWSGGSGTYYYEAGGVSTTFTYDPDDGTFTCSGGKCSELTN